MTEFDEVADWRETGALRAVPAKRGIFRIDFQTGPPYIGRTSDLRRRLRRLLRSRGNSRTLLSLRDVAATAHYRLTGSAFESNLVLYHAVKQYRPGNPRDYLKIRLAPFVKVLLGNRFPRTCLTKRLTRSRALFYGPFPNRGCAEQFHQAFLDLFGVRRCVENLDPSPSHPGCIWGEMDLCLRPCQAACDDHQYAAEVERMVRFLATDGESLLREAATARDHASASMDFESAARHHRTWSKARIALRSRGTLSHEISRQCGVVVQTSAEPDCVELTALFQGTLQPPTRLPCEGEPSGATLRTAIRRRLARRDWRIGSPSEIADHLALLQHWYGSSFKRGEFVGFPSMAEPPLRRLANAAMRVAAIKGHSAAQQSGGAPAADS